VRVRKVRAPKTVSAYRTVKRYAAGDARSKPLLAPGTAEESDEHAAALDRAAAPIAAADVTTKRRRFNNSLYCSVVERRNVKEQGERR
jgi:hypothetical protein